MILSSNIYITNQLTFTTKRNHLLSWLNDLQIIYIIIISGTWGLAGNLKAGEFCGATSYADEVNYKELRLG